MNELRSRLIATGRPIKFTMTDHGKAEDGQTYITSFMINGIRHFNEIPCVKGYGVNQSLAMREKADFAFLERRGIDSRNVEIFTDAWGGKKRWQCLPNTPT